MKRKHFLMTLAFATIFSVVSGSVSHAEDSAWPPEHSEVLDNGLSAVHLSEEKQSGPFHYIHYFNSDTATIDGYTGDTENLVLPEQVDGWKVTGWLGEVTNREKIKNVTLPKTLKDIGVGAIENTPDILQNFPNLEKITVDKDSENFKISGGALYSITKSDDYSEKWLWCYPQNGGKTSITVDKDTFKIHNYAFYNNKTLKEIVVPEHLSKIGKNAFAGCDNLNIVTVKKPTLTLKKGKKVKLYKGIFKKLDKFSPDASATGKTTMKYQSNKPRVVSVSKNSTIKAKKRGTALIRITGKNKGLKMKCSLKVKVK